MAALEVKGKTVDQAIFNGLNELGLGIDEVEIEILHDGRGLFGIGKSSVVRMTPKSELPAVPTEEKAAPKKRAQAERPARKEILAETEHVREEKEIKPASTPSAAEGFLNELFKKMNVDAFCVTVENAESDKIVIRGNDTAALIGRRGETLDAIQYITGLVLNKGKQDYKRIMLDTENYREKREEALVRLANRIAQKVSRTGRKVTLEPMNPYERRILHATLQSNPRVETLSEGEEPFRRVIVRTKRRGQATKTQKMIRLQHPGYSLFYLKQMRGIVMEDTIVAPATGAAGAISVIRVSGPGAKKIAEKIFDNYRKMKHAMMVHGKILRNGRCVDDVMAVYFAAPASYTGEDSLEISCHASTPGVYEIIRCITDAGARMAAPGEFTRRAFINGKMDLTQAEAVCDFIAATSDAGARAAQHQLQGGMKGKILGFQDKLSDLLAEAQAAIEYPEEDLETAIAHRAAPYLSGLLARINALAETFQTGIVIKNGLLTAIAGKPNVGKSSLLNALAGRERAIVAHIPGTTRDTVEHTVLIGGVPFNLTDTAGIRASRDEIEQMGVRRSVDALSSAQLTLFVADGSAPLDSGDTDAFSHVEGRAIIVLNKSDLGQAVSPDDIREKFGDVPVVSVSARTGEGLDTLREEMAAFAGTDASAAEGLLVTSARHQSLLLSAAAHIADALSALDAGMDMDCVTIDMQSAWDDLGAITGNTVTEEIIDRIFAKFCLGK